MFTVLQAPRTPRIRFNCFLLTPFIPAYIHTGRPQPRIDGHGISQGTSSEVRTSYSQAGIVREMASALIRLMGKI
jgi:hypothetical protein